MEAELEALLERWPLVKKFNLPSDSFVIVVGSYKGLTMELLDELYHPDWMVGYEPQYWAYEKAYERLGDRKNYHLVNVALVVDDSTSVLMGEWGTDACSLINNGFGSRIQETARAYNAAMALNKIERSAIDLMIMNIEGYEFELLPYLDKEKILERVQRLAVQWHLNLSPFHTKIKMDEQITLLGTSGLELTEDQRPAWTFHKRN